MTSTVTKGDRTKARILEAANALFAEQGFNGTSVRDVAARAEITHAGLLHHFPTKDEMLVRLLEHREQLEVADFLKHDASDSERFFTWLVTVVEHNANNPERVQLFVRLTAEATDANHPARSYFTRRYTRLFEAAAEHFASHFESSPPKVDISPENAAHQTIALLDGLQIQWLLMPETVNMQAQVANHLENLGIVLTTPSASPESAFSAHN